MKKIKILILIIIIIIGGFLIYKYWWGISEKKVEISKEGVEKQDLNLITTKLATVPVREYEHLGLGLYFQDVIFSPDGRKVAYTAKKGKKWIMVLNEKEVGSYDDISWGTDPTFSSDSKRFAYGAKKEGGL